MRLARRRSRSEQSRPACCSSSFRECCSIEDSDTTKESRSRVLAHSRRTVGLQVSVRWNFGPATCTAPTSQHHVCRNGFSNFPWREEDLYGPGEITRRRIPGKGQMSKVRCECVLPDDVALISEHARRGIGRICRRVRTSAYMIQANSPIAITCTIPLLWRQRLTHLGTTGFQPFHQAPPRCFSIRPSCRS